MRDPNPEISVVLPTHNRSELLASSLESLVHQSLPPDRYEVVVIDDGSSDDTPEVISSFSGRLPLKYFRIANSGLGAAKNMGIFTSSAPIIFFFDDDDVATRTLLEEHLLAHANNPDENVAILGYTTWSPSLKVSEVMHYATDVGQFLFAYKNLHDGQTLDFTYFWGGRSSCKRSLLAQHGIFDPRFKFSPEDIELGYRLSRIGLKVVYHQSAVSYMNRSVSFAQFCERAYRQGQWLHLLNRLHPDEVIRQYCGVDEAIAAWPAVRLRLERDMARVAEIEEILSAKPPVPDLINELHSLYGTTIKGQLTRGITEAANALS